MSFKPVEQMPNFVEKEHQMLDYWQKNHVVEKYLHKNDNSKEKFGFLDGPITANNPMGVHHCWGRTQKDLYQRFFNMHGRKERFQNGFDCQGLWVEVEVEKELGFKTKKDIETYGIDKFVEKCKERVLKYSQIQTAQSIRLGYFMDWDHSYYTMSDDNNYMIWDFLKVCSERGWLYEGWDSVPWCPRCGTAISQHEILTEEYKELTHESIFFRLKLKSNPFGKFPAYLLVWTTTPWTLPANVAAAVHPDLTYSLYEHNETKEKYIFIDPSVTTEMLFLTQHLDLSQFTKKKSLKGEELLGLEYEGMFDDLEAVKKAKDKNPHGFHIVIAAPDLVNANEGTGIVHIAPGCGKEDYDLSVQYKLAQITPINAEANYVAGFDDLVGQNVKNVPEQIFEKLKSRGNFFKTHKYKHRYPTCWRCKTELVFRLVEEWYIAMDRKDPTDKIGRTLREEMIDVAKEIKWIPDFGLDRELDWLNNMHDWLISKKRYWGLALPIWKCQECNEVVVVGSKQELEEKAAEGWNKFKGHTPHRPWIDEVKIKCPHCKKLMSRIKDVGNPWLDAGIVPFSTFMDPKTGKLSYMTDKKYWKKWFPSDLVLESFPGQFKNWFYSMIAMSTVLEKKAPFKTLVGYASVRDEKGEEMHKSKGNAIWFDEGAEKIGIDVMRWMYVLQPITINMKFGYNVADETRRRFHLIIWNVYKFFVTYANLDQWQPAKNKDLKLTLLDQWILERLDTTVFKVSKFIENYLAYLAAAEIETFVADLSTWYLRRSRKRVGPQAVSEEDKQAFYATMHQVLVVLMRVLAPFMPYLPDEIFQNLTGELSVHLSSFPKIEKIDVKLEKAMSLVRQIVEKGHSVRKEQNVKVRQPLGSVKYKTEESRLPVDLEDLIKEELNVKKVVYQKSKGDLEVSLDLKLTPELQAEGQIREIIRLIQEMRKELGCNFADRIDLYYDTDDKLKTLFTDFEKELKKQVLADHLVNSKDQTAKIMKEKVVDGSKVWLGIK